MMKKKQKNKLVILYAGAWFLLFSLFPIPGQSQAGRNDPFFNILNNCVWGGEKGTNAIVTNSVIQPDGKIIIAGRFTTYNGKPANQIARLNADGSLDATFNAGSGIGGEILTLTLLPDKKILISGDFTSCNGVSANYIARLHANGSIDDTFKKGPDAGANAVISDAVIQPDGKIIIAGKFTAYNNVSCNKMIRLNSNGEADTTFRIPLTIHTDDGEVNIDEPAKIALQPDGKIIAGFILGGIPSKNIIRFKPNGNVDYSFDCKLDWNDTRKFGGIVIQPDGKIIVGGGYEQFGMEDNDGYIFRLNKDGSFDPTFNSNINPVPLIHSVALQANGKIIVAGRRREYDLGVRATYFIGRLNTDGPVDSTFYFNNKQVEKNYMDSWTASIQGDGKIIVGGSFSNAETNIIRLNRDGSRDVYFNKTAGANGTVRNISLQPNEKIIISGDFSSYNLVPRNTIARLYADGNLDLSFNPGKGANGRILCTAVQPDRKIIIAGTFTQFNGTSKNRIARLNENGSVDNTYSTGSGITGLVSSFNLQPDGKLIIGGNFTSYNGIAVKGLFRLNSNGTLDSGFNKKFKALPFTYTGAAALQSDGKILIGLGSALYRLNNDGSLDSTFSGTIDYIFIRIIKVQDDGKIVVAGGIMDDLIGMSEGFVTRLNSNGSKDSTFTDSYTFSSYVRTVTVLKNKKILVGGQSGVYRLNADGTEDYTAGLEATNADGQVWCSALTTNGKVIIGGEFTAYSGIPRNGLARLKQTAPAPARNAFTETAVNTLNEEKRNILSTYPNPATNHLTVDHLTPGSILLIFNAHGELVEKQMVDNETVTIQTSDYANGLYFITNEEEYSTTGTTFIVNKR